MVLASTIHLPDGRTIGYDDVGDPEGVPVLFVHGSPDSRRARHPDDGLAARTGVRLIALDRPGFGLSSLHPTGTLGSFGDDAIALADHLGIGELRVFGWSAGAPHALAIAARHPRRVPAAAVAAGLVPFTAYETPGILEGADDGRHLIAELGAELGATSTAEMAAGMLAPHPCDHDLARAHVLEHADEARQGVYATVPGLLDAMAAGIVDAVAGGLDGLVRDLELQIEPPDVDWSDVAAPVELWYGGLDRTAPPAFGRWWADRLAQATLSVDPTEGHLIAITHWERILAILSS
jgi:pimeloyl-ACP methyl ester carboxylesterase